MQKLITIPLNDEDEEDMTVREHLKNYLENGWHITHIIPVGAGVGTGDCEAGAYVAGWVAVVLEEKAQ